MRFHKIAQPGSVSFRHILPIHNVTINSNNLFVNIFWTFTICVEKSYDGTHLAVGGNLDRRCHFKHVSLKQSRFYYCQTSTARRQRIKVDGNVTAIRIKISLSAYTIWTFTFRTSLIYVWIIKLSFSFSVVVFCYMHNSCTLCSKKSSSLKFFIPELEVTLHTFAIIIWVVLLSPYLCIHDVSLSCIHYNQSRHVYFHQTH